MSRLGVSRRSESQRSDRQRLTGEPRSPIDPDPKVCRFYGHCPKGEERCHSEMPVLTDITRSRRVACHFPEPVGADMLVPQLRVLA